MRNLRLLSELGVGATILCVFSIFTIAETVPLLTFNATCTESEQCESNLMCLEIDSLNNEAIAEKSCVCPSLGDDWSADRQRCVRSFAASCTDECYSNLKCRSVDELWSCLCEPDEIWNVRSKMCVPTLDYRDNCDGEFNECSSNMKCLVSAFANETDNATVCRCEDDEQWSVDDGLCIGIIEDSAYYRNCPGGSNDECEANLQCLSVEFTNELACQCVAGLEWDYDRKTCSFRKTDSRLGSRLIRMHAEMLNS